METFRVDFRENSGVGGSTNDPFIRFNESFTEITRAISSLHLTQSQMNTVFGSMGKLASAQSKLIGDLTIISHHQPTESAEKYICAKLRNSTTQYRRNQVCLSSALYVAPLEKAIGLHFRSEFGRDQNAAHHDLQQSFFGAMN